MARVFVLDAMGLVYRAYYAFIRRPLVNSRGENTSALFGFGNTALKIRNEEIPEYWALAWDGPGPTFRHEAYPQYKATRKPMPEDLLSQIGPLEDLAAALGLPILEAPGVEADDVMATVARRAEREGFEVALVTSDKDMLQLVNDRVRLLSPPGRGDDYIWVGREDVREKWSVAPEQIRDVLALMGDSSDNVPGVPGVGPKTAKELIAEFGTIDSMYERLGEVSRESLRRKLAKHKDQALLSRDLVTVKTDVELPFEWDDLKRAPIRREPLLAFARHYEIVRLERIARQFGVSEEEAGDLPRGRAAPRRDAMPARKVQVKTAGDDPPRSTPAPVEAPPVPPPGRAVTADTEAVAAAPAAGQFSRPPSHTHQGTLDLFERGGASSAGTGEARDALERRIHEVRARAVHGLALYPVTGGGDARSAPLVGLALAAGDGTACYVPVAHASGACFDLETVRGWLGPALADARVPKIGMGLKRAMQVLSASRLAVRGLSFDVHLASFLCDPERNHGLDALAREVLGIELPPLLPEAPRGRTRPGPAEFDSGDLAPAAVQRASVLPALADALRAQLESREQWSLYERIEHPLIQVLADMEEAGVALDREVLADMAARAGEEIERLEEELYAIAGERLNLNSGPQLSRVLFDELKLKTGRRTKTGWSTDQAVLEELAPSHPFPARLLEYRVLSKLKSTYLDTLPEDVDPADGRVHTTYHQAGAATGRLSSSNPNLQNIPMRTPQGRAIRKAFVAAPGHVLIGADYSQIELRVMAHLSEDPNLIAAFESGEDVHASTARKVFGVEGDALDPQLRSRAKIVNFGVMYGMGARSLSQQMGISLKEAREFISDYFRVYARVREFLDATVENARREGYVQTLFGRRRYLPELATGQGARRALAERVAINTPIQGSAADLMKVAMLRVHRALKRLGGSARLLLQVHDELVIECRSAEADETASCVRAEMEGCFPMRVPLEVSVGRGPTWFDVHA